MANTPVTAYAIGLTDGADRENCRYKIIAYNAAALDAWTEHMSGYIVEALTPYWFLFDIKDFVEFEQSSKYVIGRLPARFMIQRLPNGPFFDEPIKLDPPEKQFED